MAKWLPGQSGNPGGRPREGADLRERLYKAAPRVIDKLITLAEAGDPVALRIFSERVMPALRPQAQRINLVLPEGSLADQAKALLAAVVAGELPVDAASELIASLARVVAIEEGDEIRRRLEELGDLA